jgi:hypothetical protein
MYPPQINDALRHIAECENAATSARVEPESPETVEWEWVIRDLETARDEAEKARAIIVSFIEANAEPIHGAKDSD